VSRASLALAVALVAAPPGRATADDPSGCAAFKWPIERERAALAAAGKPAIANGGALAYDQVVTLKLASLAEAGLPHPPERAPQSAHSFAGHFTLAAPAKPGTYLITLASYGWIDVVDNGAFLHPMAFSGTVGCEGARKSVRFDLPARPLDIQLSGVKDAEIGVIVSPDARPTLLNDGEAPKFPSFSFHH
jgi:hypothetical protein